MTKHFRVIKKTAAVLVPILVMLYILFGQDKINHLEAQLKWAKGDQKIDILLRLSDAYKTNNPQKVIEKSQEALALLEKSPAEKHETRILNNMGQAYIDKGNYEIGLLYLNKSRKQAEEADNKQGLADALFSIAAVYRKLSNYDLAMKVNEEVLDIRTRIKDHRGTAASYGSIGQVYSAKGDFDKALEKYLQALDLQEKIKDEHGMAHTFLDIGATYCQLEKFPEAEHYYNEALKIYKKSADKLGMLQCLNSLAAVLRAKAEKTIEDNLRETFFLETLNYYHQALKIHNELGYNADMALVFISMGEVYEKLTDYTKARECYAISLKLSGDLGEKSYEAHALCNMSMMHCRLGQYKKALEMAFLALRITEELPVKPVKKRIYEDLAHIYDSMGNYKNAYEYYQKFKSLSDEILDAAGTERIAEMEVLLNTREKERQIEILAEKQKRQKYLLGFYLVVGVLILIIAVINFLLYRHKKRAEIAIHESQEKYRQLEEERLKRSKMESIGLLAGGIAHDFNNILSVILGYIELGKMGLPPESPVVRPLDKAEQAVNRAKDLGQQFLTFSENGEPVKRLASVREIVKKAVALALEHPVLKSQNITSPQDLEIKINIPANLKRVNCDPHQIQQVISSLIINGVEAMHAKFATAGSVITETAKPKGLIEITAEALSLEAQQVASLIAGKYLRLSVRDEGEGIKKEYLARLFDPYFSTRQRFNQKGLGLGLTIVYSIIKRHNGHIDITSEIGKGTTVTFYLPVRDPRCHQ